MIVLMFKNRFEDLILRGIKTHTIRGSGTKIKAVRSRGKRKINVGDQLSLRVWTGLPYRSKQRVLIETRCTCINHINIGIDFVAVDGKILNWTEIERLAFGDGFDHPNEMYGLFKDQHGLPFEGRLISWAAA